MLILGYVFYGNPFPSAWQCVMVIIMASLTTLLSADTCTHMRTHSHTTACVPRHTALNISGVLNCGCVELRGGGSPRVSPDNRTQL